LAQAFSAISSEKLLEPIHDSLNCSEDSSSFHYRVECLAQALSNEFNKRNLDEYGLS
jgi:hypothetical protein